MATPPAPTAAQGKIDLFAGSAGSSVVAESSIGCAACPGGVARVLAGIFSVRSSRLLLAVSARLSRALSMATFISAAVW